MSDKPPGTVILTGVVGSRAYGWATPESDTDRHGIFVMPTERFLGAYPPQQADLVFRQDPDTVFHEVGHFIRLALRCNPSALELLFLEGVEHLTDFGQELRNLRESFLSGPAVADAYLSYARQQARRLRRTKEDPSADEKARAEKNARHMKRLLMQGLELYQTGHLTVKVGDREQYYAFGAAAVDDPSILDGELERAAQDFAVRSCLPEEPNGFLVDLWLKDTRKAML